MSIFENVLLPNARGPFDHSSRHRSLFDAVIREFAVTPDNSHLRFRELSGGNQQKVIVGKWLSRRPKLLILDDPNRSRSGSAPNHVQRRRPTLPRRRTERAFALIRTGRNSSATAIASSQSGMAISSMSWLAIGSISSQYRRGQASDGSANEMARVDGMTETPVSPGKGATQSRSLAAAALEVTRRYATAGLILVLVVASASPLLTS